jgi:uncharacterized protein YkwD
VLLVAVIGTVACLGLAATAVVHFHRDSTPVEHADRAGSVSADASGPDGGSGSTTTTAPATTTPDTPAPEPAPPAPAATVPAVTPAPASPSVAPAPAPAPPSAASLSPSAILVAVNAVRTSRGLGAYSASGYLTGTAQSWAQSIAGTGNPVHQDMNAVLAGGGFHVAGENLYGTTGLVSAQDVVNAWMASPGHAERVIDPTCSMGGVGVAAGSGGWTWVVLDVAG